MKETRLEFSKEFISEIGDFYTQLLSESEIESIEEKSKAEISHILAENSEKAADLYQGS